MNMLCANPILAPVLRELWLQMIEFIHNSDMLTLPLQEMLKSRTRAGHRIDRLVAQVGVTNVRLIEKVRYALVEHVEVFEFVDSSEPALCEFEGRDVWNVERADLYWKPQDSQLPQYCTPVM